MTTLSLCGIAIPSETGWSSQSKRQLRCHMISFPAAPLRCWHLSHKVHTWSHLISVIGDLHELVFGGILVSSILLKLNGKAELSETQDPFCVPLIVLELALFSFPFCELPLPIANTHSVSLWRAHPSWYPQLLLVLGTR